MWLVCTNGKRDACCARDGLPVARALAALRPDEAWECSHLGGHRFAANVALAPRRPLLRAGRRGGRPGARRGCRGRRAPARAPARAHGALPAGAGRRDRGAARPARRRAPPRRRIWTATSRPSAALRIELRRSTLRRDRSPATPSRSPSPSGARAPSRPRERARLVRRRRPRRRDGVLARAADEPGHRAPLVPGPAIFLLAAAVAVGPLPAPRERARDAAGRAGRDGRAGRSSSSTAACTSAWRRFRDGRGADHQARPARHLRHRRRHRRSRAHWLFGLVVDDRGAPRRGARADRPAAVFSVLGKREIVGRSGTILEGESGANDPVGIALMLGAARPTSERQRERRGTSAREFVALAGRSASRSGSPAGWRCARLVRRVPLPSRGALPAAHARRRGRRSTGSRRCSTAPASSRSSSPGSSSATSAAPCKRGVERFHASLASLAEIVAFVALGLSVDLDALGWDWLRGHRARRRPRVRRPPARRRPAPRADPPQRGERALRRLGRAQGSGADPARRRSSSLAGVGGRAARLRARLRRRHVLDRRAGDDHALARRPHRADAQRGRDPRQGELPPSDDEEGQGREDGARCSRPVSRRSATSTSGAPLSAKTLAAELERTELATPARGRAPPPDGAAGGRDLGALARAAPAARAAGSVRRRRRTRGRSCGRAHRPRACAGAAAAAPSAARRAPVERLARVHVDVDPDQVDERARPDRPVEPEAHRAVESSGETPVSSRTRIASFSSGMRIRLTTKPGVSLQTTGSLPSCSREGDSALHRRRRGALGPHDLDERQHGRRVEEVHPDDALRAGAAAAIAETESAEVLVARMRPGRRARRARAKSACFALELLDDRLDHGVAAGERRRARRPGAAGRARRRARPARQTPLLDAARRGSRRSARARAPPRPARRRRRRRRGPPARRPARSRSPSPRARRRRSGAPPLAGS